MLASEMRKEIEKDIVPYVISTVKNHRGRVTWEKGETYTWPRYDDINQDWVINELKLMGYDVYFHIITTGRWPFRKTSKQKMCVEVSCFPRKD